MLRHLITQWLTSQVTPELQARLHQAAADSVREAVHGASEANAEYEKARQSKPVACGFVFALPSEYGCLTDLMSGVTVTRGGGFKYTDGHLARRRVVLVESGVGVEKAAAATEALVQAFRPERIVSAGFSGALVNSLDRHRIVLPTVLIDQKSGETLDFRQKYLSEEKDENTSSGNSTKDHCNAETEKGAKESEKTGSEQKTNDSKPADSFDARFAAGTLLTAEKVVESPVEKRRLAQMFVASLVDMEGFAVGSVCQKLGVPFLSVRVILDEAGETLPGDLKNIADAASANPARLFGALVGAVSKRPSSLLELYKLKENALIAADTLAGALKEILES